MTRRKKTKTGVNLTSTRGSEAKTKPIWWLAIVEKNRVQIFSYSLSTKKLDSIFLMDQGSFHDAVSKVIRDSAGRSQASFSRAQGGHQTGHPRHAYSSLLTPAQKASEHILKPAADFLKAENKKGSYQALALIGHAQTVGHFRQLLDSKTQKKITLQSTHFANYLSTKKQASQLLKLVPQPSEPPLRWLPNRNLRKG